MPTLSRIASADPRTKVASFWTPLPSHYKREFVQTIGRALARSKAPPANAVPSSKARTTFSRRPCSRACRPAPLNMWRQGFDPRSCRPWQSSRSASPQRSLGCALAPLGIRCARISLQTFSGPDGGVSADYEFLIDAFGALQDENFEPTGVIGTLAPSTRWAPHPCLGRSRRPKLRTPRGQ